MIGKRLRALRIEKGQKQADIASMLGVSRTTYTQYETEKSEPDLETVKKLAGIFSCSTDYLLGNTDTRTPPDPVTDTNDAPIAFMGETADLNVEALQQIIKDAVKEAIEEKGKE